MATYVLSLELMIRRQLGIVLWRNPFSQISPAKEASIFLPHTLGAKSPAMDTMGFSRGAGTKSGEHRAPEGDDLLNEREDTHKHSLPTFGKYSKCEKNPVACS